MKVVARRLAPLVGLVVFAIALVALHHTLRHYHIADIRQAWHTVSGSRILIALALVVCSYAVLTLYDVLGLRYAGERVPYRRVGLVSFIGWALSNSVGFSVLSGGAVRFRMYSQWGVSASGVVKVITLSTVTAWLGISTIAGFACLLEPHALSALWGTHHVPIVVLGLLFLAFPIAYLLWATTSRRFAFRRWSLEPPALAIAIPQVLLGAADFALAAGVMYVLLPEGSISYPAFMGLFVAAILGGFVSQVPGGLGVFESILLVLLANQFSPADLFVRMLMFRVLYDLLPLVVGLVMLSGYELMQRRLVVQRIGTVYLGIARPVITQFMALAILLCGAMLLYSGATPAEAGNLHYLRRILPLPVIEMSHFLASILGVALLLLARAVQRRINAAYWAVLALLAAGAAFSLLKGLDYEEAIILGAMFLILVPCRREFYRNASILQPSFGAGWVLAVGMVLLSSMWVGIFAYKHVEYSGEMWWQFSFQGDAPRFLRATVGVLVFAGGFALFKLLAPVRHAVAPAAEPDLRDVEPIVTASHDVMANLALLGDKTILMDDRKSAFIMYAVEGRSFVAMGDPIGDSDAFPELIWRYKELADAHGGWPVFYEVRPDTMPLYVDIGLTLIKLGEEGRVSLAEFSLDGSAWKDERYTLRKLEKQGVAFEVIPAVDVPALLPVFKTISDEWLLTKHVAEKGFSLGFFDKNYLSRYPHAIVRNGGDIVAFANLWPGHGSDEFSVDLMRYSNAAPSGIMDFLFLHLMLWGREAGHQWFSMGMAPLSGLENRQLAPLWNRAGALLFAHGEHFYNFQGLRQYKEKFHPQWESRYLAAPGGIVLPRALANVASLISGGLAGLVKKPSRRPS